MPEKILTGAMIRAALDKKAATDAAKSAPDAETTDKPALAAKKG